MTFSIVERRAPPPPPPYESPGWNFGTVPPGANCSHPGTNVPPAARPPSDERTPLLNQQSSEPAKQEKRSTFFAKIIIVLVFVAIVLYLVMTDIQNPAVRNHIRRQWEREIRGYEKIRQTWMSELADHEKLRVGWEHERQEVIAMRADLDREKEEWERHRAEERWQDERRRREEEERVRAGFYWANITGKPHCLRHGARQYSARISNVPAEHSAVKACMLTPFQIHGSKLPTPDRCEDRGIYGQWTVDFDEPACNTFFDTFSDKGCTSPGSRHRRIESKLMNLEPGGDWRDMCYSTPADFRNLHFDGPHICDNAIWGTWGKWDIEDESC
ncbi:hypothetical protein B0H10DRAFT_2047413 [Mycena sp. CBHHK59/15]|nr:hypothetical protein B0H10DRAFT_2047413 [Mycena sp. CBHHK59/15]